MKIVVILSLLLLAVPASGQLTKDDLRTIVKEENAALEKRLKEYIDLKVDGVEQSLNARIDGVEKNLNTRIDGVEQSLNARIDALDQRISMVERNLIDRIGDLWRLMIGIIGLITAAIAVPQIIIAFKARGARDIEERQAAFEAELHQLREQLQVLQNPPSNPRA